MTLKKFLDLFDNWNVNIFIKNDELDYITEMKIADLMANGRFQFKGMNEELMRMLDSEVLAFGFYDGELCVRVDY